MAEQTIADRYKLDGTPIDGGQATIYPAIDALLDRRVAIKVARKGDEAMYAALVREARYLARLRHPHIMTLFDFFEVGDRVAFVMPLYEGHLDERLRADETFSRNALVSVFEAVAEALDHCVDGGLVHRDIKPGNILVGDGRAVTLCDFGIATEIDDRGDWNGIVGSQPFIAPELFLSEIDPEFRTVLARRTFDQFALGVTAYRTLTGRLPFQLEPGHSDPRASCTAINLIRGKNYAPCHVVNEKLPPGLDDVIRRMTSVDPRTRYPSNRDAVEALRQALAGYVPGASRIFVSYSRLDKPFVQSLTTALEGTERVQVRWDAQLVPGTDWDDQIEEAMVESDAMLVVLSRNSALSPEVKSEWRYWIGALGRPILSLVLDDCRIPYRLHGHHQLRIGVNAANDPVALAETIVRALPVAVQAMKRRAERDGRGGPNEGGNVPVGEIAVWSYGSDVTAFRAASPTQAYREGPPTILAPRSGGDDSATVIAAPAASPSQMSPFIRPPASSGLPSSPASAVEDKTIFATVIRRDLSDYAVTQAIPGRLQIEDFKTVIAGIPGLARGG